MRRREPTYEIFNSKEATDVFDMRGNSHATMIIISTLFIHPLTYVISRDVHNHPRARHYHPYFLIKKFKPQRH